MNAGGTNSLPQEDLHQSGRGTAGAAPHEGDAAGDAGVSLREAQASRVAPHKPDLRRLTLNLTRHGHDALTRLLQLTGDSQTDVVNRALRVYAYLEEIRERNGRVVVEDGDRHVELLFI